MFKLVNLKKRQIQRQMTIKVHLPSMFKAFGKRPGFKSNATNSQSHLVIFWRN